MCLNNKNKISKKVLLIRLLKIRPYLEKKKLNKVLQCLYKLDNSFIELIKSLYTSGDRNIDSFISEAYVIYDIKKCLKTSNTSSSLLYEKPNENGRPDLKIHLIDSSITLCIQLKCFSDNEVDARREKSLKKITSKLNETYPNRNFNINTSISFTEKTAENVVIQLNQWTDTKKSFLHMENDEKIEIIESPYSTYSYGISIIKDEYVNQVKKSYLKAQKSLTLPGDCSINIIICHDYKGEIDRLAVGNALFGTKGIKYYMDGSQPMFVRRTDGIIHDDRSKKDGMFYVNYYLFYVSNKNILDQFNRYMYQIEEVPYPIDISKLFNIKPENIYTDKTYINV